MDKIKEINIRFVKEDIFEIKHYIDINTNMKYIDLDGTYFKLANNDYPEYELDKDATVNIE